jgi:protease I
MDLSGKTVALVATDYFEEAELTSPRDALQAAGATVHVIAPHSGEITGLKHVEPGASVAVDKTLDEANADALRMNQKARDFAIKMMDEQEKPTAVICHGPWLLVSSHLVDGKHLTSFYTIQDDIRNAGGIWSDEEVVVDGNLITSRKPDDLPAFNKALLKAIADS